MRPSATTPAKNTARTWPVKHRLRWRWERCSATDPPTPAVAGSFNAWATITGIRTKPRESAFGRGRADTVAEIADLPTIDAANFFAETHVTEGVGVLLRQIFDRLMGRSDQGVFRLRQAMGGGNTHNLLAAALLARDAVQRKAVLQRIGVAADGRPLRIAAFSGRETDTSEYLWVSGL